MKAMKLISTLAVSVAATIGMGNAFAVKIVNNDASQHTLQFMMGFLETNATYSESCHKNMENEVKVTYDKGVRFGEAVNVTNENESSSYDGRRICLYVELKGNPAWNSFTKGVVDDPNCIITVNGKTDGNDYGWFTFSAACRHDQA